MALMEKAQARASFKKPDISPFIPKGQEDAVARIAAAGVKLLYSPSMREQVMEAVNSDVPIAQKLGENVTGLILMLDQKSPQGIPAEAMFPAAMELLGEASEVLTAAGQSVTQDDYNEAAMLVMIELGRRMGATDEQLMQVAQQAAGMGVEPEKADPMPDEMEGQP